MAIHDWFRVPPGLFHHFHQVWSVALCKSLNDGLLPDGFYALVERHAIGLIPDVLTLQRGSVGLAPQRPNGGAVVSGTPPQARFVLKAATDSYVERANRIAIRSTGGDLVAVIEIVSPGNKQSAHALRSFVQKTAELLYAGVNLLVVDLFPPSIRNPNGIHPLIWAEIRDEPFELPADKPMTLAAYGCGPDIMAYVEPIAAGDPLPDMPIFIAPDTYVPARLEETYELTWSQCPREFRESVLRVA